MPYLFYFSQYKRLQTGHFAISMYLWIYGCISHKTARVVRQTPSWSHRGADIVDCTIVVVSLHVDEQLCQAIWLLDYWIGCSDGPKLRYLAKNVKISKFFYVPDEYFFFKKNIQKYFKSGFLYVLDDSEMIWEKNIFSIFRTKSSALAHSGGRTVHLISISL